MIPATQLVTRHPIIHYLSAVRLEHGGVVRAVLDLCETLNTHGADVTLITRDPHDVPQRWADRPCGLRVISTSNNRGTGSFLARSEIARIEPVVADAGIVHLHGAWEPSNLQLASLARKHGVPYVVSPHGMLDDWPMSQRALKKRLFLKVWGSRLFDRAAAVHYTASAEARQAQKWLRHDRAGVIPLIVALSEFRQLPGPNRATQRYDIPPAAPVALFLSRLHPKKGPDVFIRAARQLAAQDNDTLFLLAGSGKAGYEASLRELAISLGIGERVRFLGVVSGADKLSLLQRADVFVLPTLQENFGFALIEALACGTPVVTSHEVDLADELAGAGALLCDRTPEAISEAVHQVLSNPQFAEARGKNGRGWVFSSLEPAHLIRRYGEFYASAQRQLAAAR